MALLLLATVSGAVFQPSTAERPNVQLAPPADSGQLTITVTDPGGTPIQGATARIIGGPFGQTYPMTMMTGSDGTATFTSLAPGTYTTRVTATGYFSETDSVLIVSRQTCSLSVSLTPTSITPTTGTLKVTISGATGVIEGALVTISSGPYGQTLPAGATTGTDGTVTFTNLAPGSYSYAVSANSYQAGATNTATVAPGQTTPSQTSLTHVQQTSNSPADYTLYIVAAIAIGIAASVAALVVLLGVFLGLRRKNENPLKKAEK